MQSMEKLFSLSDLTLTKCDDVVGVAAEKVKVALTHTANCENVVIKKDGKSGNSKIGRFEMRRLR